MKKTFKQFMETAPVTVAFTFMKSSDALNVVAHDEPECDSEKCECECEDECECGKDKKEASPSPEEVIDYLQRANVAN